MKEKRLGFTVDGTATVKTVHKNFDGKNVKKGLKQDFEGGKKTNSIREKEVMAGQETQEDADGVQEGYMRMTRGKSQDLCPGISPQECPHPDPTLAGRSCQIWMGQSGGSVEVSHQQTPHTPTPAPDDCSQNDALNADEGLGDEGEMEGVRSQNSSDAHVADEDVEEEV